MKCNNCGAYIEEDSKFCQYCGSPNAGYVKPPVQPVYQAKPQHSAQSAPVNVYVNETHYHEAAPKQHVVVNVAQSEKSRVVLLALWLLLGGFGIHKFYQGKIGMGILYLCTFGIFGLGLIVDFFSILFGTPRDKYGLPIRW